ncbi:MULTISPECIES: hypothetical protein [unclassified Microcoleus]|uniref:hypothetical protein n=1 Tax=unclassified Microcoleus TaxID=2642155 RepID=UPI002FD219FB
MMGVSTRIVLVPIFWATQKLSANCLANYAAAVHPDIRRKQRRSIVPKFLRPFSGFSKAGHELVLSS